MAATDQINAKLRQLPTWPIYVLGLLPVVWLFYAAIGGQLGVDPVKAIEHRLGLWSLWALIAGLCITPLCTYTNLRLVKFRRAIGLMAFIYVAMHLLVWLVLDVQILANVWADILKRPYITIGMAAFVCLLPLAITSNNWSIRKLGAAGWQRLHRLTYVVVVLGCLHYVMLVKGWQVEPLLYLAAVMALLGVRLLPKRRRRASSAKTAARSV